jgi:uncharacterized protein YacL
MAQSPDQLHPKQAAARQRSLILRIVRILFAILVVTFTMLAVLNAVNLGREQGGPLWLIPTIAAVVLVATVVAVDLLTPVKKISTLTGVLVGILVGLLATLAISGLLDLLMQSWVPNESALQKVRPLVDGVKIIVGISLSYLGIVTVLQTQDDFRLVIPYVEFAKQIRGVRPLLVDSSALIDGRIVDMAGTNFLAAPLVIPRFVVAELQLLSDSADALRRARGRRGLDMISRLQRLGTVDVTIDETPVPGKAVDQMLVELARSMPAMVLTTDMGLSRVAAIQSVQVLNLHDLANAMRTSLVAGEGVRVKLIREGEQPGQGVGYLPDGTMVVAENGGRQVGEVVDLTVTSSLQTAAGRLIFARIEAASGGERAGDAPAPGAPGEGDAPASGTTLSHAGEATGDQEGSRATDHALASAEAATRASAEADPQGSHGNEAARSPFPPKAPRSLKIGTPRNPRR